MDFWILVAVVVNIALVCVIFSAGFAVLRFVKMKELEHEMTYGEPAAAEQLRRQHAKRVTKAGARSAVTQTIASLRPAPGTRPRPE